MKFPVMMSFTSVSLVLPLISSRMLREELMASADEDTQMPKAVEHLAQYNQQRPDNFLLRNVYSIFDIGTGDSSDSALPHNVGAESAESWDAPAREDMRSILKAHTQSGDSATSKRAEELLVESWDSSDITDELRDLYIAHYEAQGQGQEQAGSEKDLSPKLQPDELKELANDSADSWDSAVQEEVRGILKEQTQSDDTATRQRAEELLEDSWDSSEVTEELHGILVNEYEAKAASASSSEEGDLDPHGTEKSSHETLPDDAISDGLASGEYELYFLDSTNDTPFPEH